MWNYITIIFQEEKKMIAIGSDHGGYELKKEIIKHLAQRGIECRDFGTESTAY